MTREEQAEGLKHLLRRFVLVTDKYKGYDVNDPAPAVPGQAFFELRIIHDQCESVLTLCDGKDGE